jgi:hypothetical protein
VLWVVRMYLRAAARTFRFHKHIHRSHLTLCVDERANPNFDDKASRTLSHFGLVIVMPVSAANSP